MAGRTPAEAVNSYIERLGQAISCVSPAVISVGGGYFPAEEPHRLIFNGGLPIRLNGPFPINIKFRQEYRIIDHESEPNAYRCTVTGYSYQIADADRREILNYQFHRIRGSDQRLAHFHLGTGAGTLIPQLFHNHLPTNRVAIEDVLWVLLDDFAVTPKRSDWRKVLTTTRVPFDQYHPV